MSGRLRTTLTRVMFVPAALLFVYAVNAHGQTTRPAAKSDAAKGIATKNASAASVGSPATPNPTASMTITGDREAPLVLSIIPWVDPKAITPPEVPLQVLLPKVIDYNRSLLDEPINRAVGAPQRATASN